MLIANPGRSGGIGRRAWFRSTYSQGCGGSSPFFGTVIFPGNFLSCDVRKINKTTATPCGVAVVFYRSYFFGTVGELVEVFGTVTGAATHGDVVDVPPFIRAAALFVDVALLVWMGEVLLDVVPVVVVAPVPAVDVAELGMVADAEVLPPAEVDGIMPAGHGFVAVLVVVVLLVPGVAAAPAGVFALGFVVD